VKIALENSLQTKSARADTADVPGTLHQGILALFRDDPWLGFDLLGQPRLVDGTPIDRSNELDHDGTRLLQVNPVYPDVVLVFEDPNNFEHGIVICLEAQRYPDPEKYWQVCLYVALLRHKHRLPVKVVVISFSPAFSQMVRGWSDLDPPIDALLLDADSVPIMTLEQARERPTAAVLAAALHGVRGNIDMARIATTAIQDLPESQRHSYTATILAALPEQQRSRLIEELPVKQRDELWDIEKRSGTYLLGRREGRLEGRLTTLAELILTVLDVRGVAVDPVSAARIRAEQSLPTLERWTVAAREIGRISELFDLQ
jgi:hypothetical protein